MPWGKSSYFFKYSLLGRYSENCVFSADKPSDIVIASDPGVDCSILEKLLGPFLRDKDLSALREVTYLEQKQRGFGERLSDIAQRVKNELNFSSQIIIGSDSPALPVDYLRQAKSALLENNILWAQRRMGDFICWDFRRILVTFQKLKIFFKKIKANFLYFVKCF